MSDTPTLASRIKTQLLNCEGFDGDTISKDRETALNYYFQRARDDEVVGRSAVVSGDVSAMVEATLAQMMEAFSSDRICDFDPLDSDDETQAQLESEAVQWFVMGRENGFLELLSAIKEALLLRNGVIKIEAEDRTERRTRRLANVEPEALSELITADDVVKHRYDEKTKELTVTVERTRREFRMSSVSLENFVYHSEWMHPTLEGIPICAERHLDTRSELLAQFPKMKTEISGLTAHKHDLKAEGQARNPRNNKKPSSPVDSSQEMVEWYEAYVYMDGGDGISELHRVAISYVDTVILEDIPVPFCRLAAGTAILNPHRFTGISLFDKLKQNQDIRTALRRALLDNVNATTKNRLAIMENIVNEDDVTSGRVNNAVRVKATVPDVRQAVMPLVVPDTSSNILANLESTARERSEMGGAALDMQSAQMQIGGDRMGSQGLEKAYSVAEQLSAAMMKTIAATLIRDVFLLAHRTLREYFDEPVPVKRNGKWTHVTPSKWPERHNVTVKPGMSPGERTRRANALGQVIDSQLMLADKGLDGVLVGINEFHRAVMDWARLSEVQNPEQYFLDPESEGSQLAMQNKSKQAEELDMQKKSLMQASFGLEQLRMALDKYTGDADRQFKYFAEILGVEVEEAKMVSSATIDIAKARREADEQANKGSDEAGGDSTVEEQAAALSAGSET